MSCTGPKMSFQLLLHWKSVGSCVSQYIAPKMPSLIFFTLTLTFNIFSQDLGIEKITRVQGSYIVFLAVLVRPNSIIRNSKKAFKIFYSVQISLVNFFWSMDHMLGFEKYVYTYIIKLLYIKRLKTICSGMAFIIIIIQIWLSANDLSWAKIQATQFILLLQFLKLELQ